MSTSAAQEKSADNGEYSILDSIIAETRLTPDDEAYDIAKRGVSAFIEELLKPQNNGEPVKKAMVDRMIAEIDAKLSRQIDEILHHPDFQTLESAWRGLKFLVDRTDFRENIKVEMLNVSKEDLLDDFEDSPGGHASPACTSTSTPPSTASSAASLWARSSPTTTSSPGRRTSSCCRRGRVACDVARAVHRRRRPEVLRSGKLPRPAGPEGPQVHFEGPQYAKWQSFRESEDARYVGLTVPRFLLRLPYDPEDGPGEGVQLQGRPSPTATSTTCGATPPTRSPPAGRQLRQVPLVPEHHRPAERWRG